MRTLIVGLGSVGRRHLRNLQSLGEDEIVLLRTGKSTLPDGELAGLPVVQSLPLGLDLHPQAVIVANPTAYHLDVAIPAAEAGCHLLLEKPISHSMERVPELAAVAAASGSRILVGFQFRFHPCLRRLRELVSNGELGQPLHARAQYGEYLPGWHPWEDHRTSYSSRSDLGGGALLTLCHPFDYLNWLFGEPVGLAARTARLSYLELQGVEGMAEVLLEHPSGTLSNVHLNFAQRPPVHRLEIVGTEGSADCDFLTGILRWWTQAAGEWQVDPAPPGFERNHLFLEEVRHFRDVVEKDAAPQTGLKEGIACLRVALAALDAGRRAAPMMVGVGGEFEAPVDASEGEVPHG